MDKAKKPLTIAAIAVGALILAILLEFGASFIQSRIYKQDYEDIISKYADEYDLPESLVYAVIDVESDFDPFASSGKAYGLMQLTPSTFDWLASNEHFGENLAVDAIFEPETNIKYGCYYLRYLLDKFQITDTALAAYNAGPSRVEEWLKSPYYSDGEGGLENIPFKETREYVKKVNKSRKYYEAHIKNGGN